MFHVIPLGSCSLTIPLMRLQRRNLVTSALVEVGFKRWPLSFSPGAALQLVNLARGQMRIPPRYREICYSGVPDRIAANAPDLLARANLVLVEMSTPLELNFRRFTFNHNRLRTYITAKFASLDGAAQTAARKWVGSLHRSNRKTAQRRVSELVQIVDEKLDDTDLRAVISGTRAHHSGAVDMARYLGEIKTILGLPIGVVIFNYRYMPDGRPVEWPAGFNANVRTAAKRLHIPVYDPTALVERHGVETAIDEDGGHYAYEFNEIVADEYVAFMSSVLDSGGSSTDAG